MAHGGDIYNHKVRLDFSVNTNPFGTPAAVLSAMREAVYRGTVYPDPSYKDLKNALAEMEGSTPEKILVGNGASELLMAAVQGSEEASCHVALLSPCFSGYLHALNSLKNLILTKVPLSEGSNFAFTNDTLEALLRSGAGLIILGNPNNPNGARIPEELLRKLLGEAKKQGVRLILDESFLPFTKDWEKYEKSICWSDYPDVIRIRSFTKTMAIPGIRMGYALCETEKTRAEIEAHLPEWNVSVIAEAAAIEAAKCDLSTVILEKELKLERDFLRNELLSRGIHVYPSDANYLLLRTNRAIYDIALCQGILIRDCRDFEGLGAGYYRIAIKKREENEELLKALDGKKEQSVQKISGTVSGQTIQHVLPADIEKNSFAILTAELEAQGKSLTGDQAPIVKRAIHTTADFDYYETLSFSKDAVAIAKQLIREGADIVTDTNMALTGINKKELSKYGGEVHCFMADPQAAKMAKEMGTTRAYASMEMAAKLPKKQIFVIGNAPTALIHLHEMMEQGTYRPAFIIGVPVGFVNVEAAKELILESDVPYIVNRGRKGGSNVAAAIVNALLYAMREEE